MSVKVYVLLATAPGATQQVFDQVSKAPQVTESHQVLGPYDIVVEIDAPSLADVPGIVAEQIRSIEGIQSTTSLVSFSEP